MSAFQLKAMTTLHTRQYPRRDPGLKSKILWIIIVLYGVLLACFEILTLLLFCRHSCASQYTQQYFSLYICQFIRRGLQLVRAVDAWVEYFLHCLYHRGLYVQVRQDVCSLLSFEVSTVCDFHQCSQMLGETNQWNHWPSFIDPLQHRVRLK